MAFDLSALLRESAAEMQQETLRSISLDLIDEDERNFYSMDTQGIEALAENIELCGLMDPIRVRENGGRYTVVSGHRRRAACMKLRDEGNEKFTSVPCIVETAGSEAMQELRLIYANRNTRTLTSADIARQAERVTELLYKLKEEGMEFPGRMVEHVAQACNVSTSKLKRLNAIKNNLSAEFYSCFQAGTLNETAAYAIARLPREIQEGLARKQKVMNLAQKKDGISGMRVDDAIRRGAEYEAEHNCTQNKSVVCGHHIDRYAATICNDSWKSCPGGCCCNCEYAASCAYPCSNAKKQIAEKKAREQFKLKAAEDDRIQQKNFEQGLRRLRHFSQVCRLADLCDRAGLPDEEKIDMQSWSTVTAGAVRRLATEGLPSDYNVYFNDYHVLNISLYDIEELAKKLKCTVGELAGEEPVKESTADTKNKWQPMTEFPDVDGWYLVRQCGCLKYPDACYYRSDIKTFAWGPNSKDGDPIDDFVYWAPCPPITEE